jgi:hypothetical protein
MELNSFELAFFECISFSLIILNVSLLPTLKGELIKIVFSLVTLYIGVGITYLVFKFIKDYSE